MVLGQQQVIVYALYNLTTEQAITKLLQYNINEEISVEIDGS